MTLVGFYHYLSLLSYFPPASQSNVALMSRSVGTERLFESNSSTLLSCCASAKEAQYEGTACRCCRPFGFLTHYARVH